MPFAIPREPSQQRFRIEQSQKAFGSTRRVPPPALDAAPAPDPFTQLKELAELRTSGVLTDEEFTAQKTKLLSDGTA
jgi:hypothetical protein